MHPSKPASLVLLRLATLLAALKISDLFALAHAVRHNYAIQEGGPGRARPQGRGSSMKDQFVYLNVDTSIPSNELDSVCLNGRAGQGKPSRRWSRIPVRIFKSPYI